MSSLAERIRQQEEEKKKKSLAERIREANSASSQASLKVTTAKPGTIIGVKTADQNQTVVVNRGPLVGPVPLAPKLSVVQPTTPSKPLMVAPLPQQPKISVGNNYSLPNTYSPSTPLPAEPFQPAQGFNQQAPNYGNQTTGQVVGVDGQQAPAYKQIKSPLN